MFKKFLQSVAYKLVSEEFLVSKGWVWNVYVSKIVDELEAELNFYKARERECEQALIRLEKELREKFKNGNV